MASKKQPWWIEEEILDGCIGTTTHEPMAHRIRCGGGPEDVEEDYRRKFSEATARELAERGFNFVEVAFFKGFGLKAEREEMQRTKRFFKYCRQFGIHTGVYTQWSSLFIETFFREVPEARDWVQIGVEGRPIEYGERMPGKPIEWAGNHYFRWRGCPGNPDFLNYLKRAVDVAVKDMKADVVYFDNLCLFEFHDTLCYCPACRRGFREYLRRKYPVPRTLFMRLGIRHIEDDFAPPPFRPWSDFTTAFVPIKDPLIQEFVEFRCEQLAAAWAEIGRHLRQVAPRVALMANPSFPRKYNERLTSAIDFWLLKDTPAMHYMENNVLSVGVRDGTLVSNIRGYKAGRALGLTFVPCGGEDSPGLVYCEGLAFNDGSGTLRSGHEPYQAFFKQYREEFYRQVEPLSEIAVLRHDRSLTWRWHEAYAVKELAEQTLICSGLPWMTLWGQQLLDGTLAAYRVLVVPGCACLSRKETEKILEFVRAGGGVVILENAGSFDEYHHRIERWRFAPLFGSAPAGGFEMRYADGLRAVDFGNKRALFARYGNGRAVYLPQIRRSAAPIRTYDELGGYMSFAHLRLPANWRALPRAVERVAGAPLAARIVGPATLTAEFLCKKGSGRLHVHLVNYARGRVKAGAEIRVAGVGRAAARLYLPAEGVARREMRPARGRGGTTVFRLPGFARYALAVVE